MKKTTDTNIPASIPMLIEPRSGAVKLTATDGPRTHCTLPAGRYLTDALSGGTIFSLTHRKSPKATRLDVDADALVEYGHEIFVRQNVASGYRGADRQDDWHGGSASEWCKRRYTADRSAAELADEVFAEVDTRLNLESLMPERVASPVGGAANVGAFLRGAPNSMYRQVEQMSDSGPVRIFADLTSSAGVGNDLLRGRAIAVLALARAIQTVRPVELWGCCAARPAGGDTLICARIGTAPFDVSGASRVMCDQFMIRAIMYQIAPLLGGAEMGKDLGHLSWTRTAFSRLVEAGENDIALGGAHLRDCKTIAASPAAWVHSQFLMWADKGRRDKTSAATSHYGRV